LSSRHPPTQEPRRPDEPSFGAEPALRAELDQAAGRAVLTGGQTGVDTAAAIAALGAGLAVHIVFPRGFRQEDGPLTEARRRALRGATLHELPSPDFSYRTWTCVHLADAVILIDPAGGDGCQETIRAAARFGRPLLSLAAGPQFFHGESNPQGLGQIDELCAWLTVHRPRVLMFAGCRASLLANATPGLDLDGQLEAIIAEFAGQS
jgi:hypothetical protein